MLWGAYVRIPNDISLETYIRRLIKANRIIDFYKSDDWLELKAEVLEHFHNECQRCLEKGKVTFAQCVHHVNHVKKRPDLALSKYYIDDKGNKQYNLLPLCNACHNIEHPEKLNSNIYNNKFINKERW